MRLAVSVAAIAFYIGLIVGESQVKPDIVYATAADNEILIQYKHILQEIRDLDFCVQAGELIDG